MLELFWGRFWPLSLWKEVALEMQDSSNWKNMYLVAAQSLWSLRFCSSWPQKQTGLCKKDIFKPVSYSRVAATQKLSARCLSWWARRSNVCSYHCPQIKRQHEEHIHEEQFGVHSNPRHSNPRVHSNPRHSTPRAPIILNTVILKHQ